VEGSYTAIGLVLPPEKILEAINNVVNFRAIVILTGFANELI